MNYLSADDLQGISYKELYNTILDLYSNEIDDLYLEKLFNELKQLSNSSEEFYEYRRLVIQSIIDDFNNETIADDIMSKNALGDLFDGIEFNKKVIISKEQPDHNSVLGKYSEVISICLKNKLFTL